MPVLGGNECVLKCKSSENKTIYKELRKIDGMPCNRPAIFYTHYYRGRAVCVQGICKVYKKSILYVLLHYLLN